MPCGSSSTLLPPGNPPTCRNHDPRVDLAKALVGLGARLGVERLQARLRCGCAQKLARLGSWGMSKGMLSPCSLGLLVVGVLVAAVPAVANESTFSFMMHERYVSGKHNGVTHGLSAGTLGVSVELEACQCGAKDSMDLQAIGAPEVTIEIWEQGFLDKLVCNFNIRHPNAPGKMAFSTPCRSVPSAVFYIVAYRGRSARCAISATGRLVTK